MTVSTLWPNEWPLPASYGLLGDYVGGFWGTLISVLTLIVVFFTWRSTRRSEARGNIVAILAEMLKTHEALMTAAPGVSARFLREFAAIYKSSRRIVPDDKIWSVEDRIDISYTFAFYGLSTQARHSLSVHGDCNLQLLQDAVSKIRDKAGGRYKGLFVGQQATLSHYMRNLFSMYTLIDGANLKPAVKASLGKIVRTKLSNYDQALLALNVISHLGREWEARGLITTYKPIANVPQHFFGYDAALSLKAHFPTVEFEWERARGVKPIYRRLSFGKWAITLTRS